MWLSQLRRFVTRRVPNLFVKGFLVTLPILATLAIVRWLWGNFESFLGEPLRSLTGEGGPEARGLWRYFHYYPGMGTVTLLLLILIVGLALNSWVMRGLLNAIGDLLDRIPLIKSIYGSVRDLTEFFSSRDGKIASQVVMVQVTPPGTPGISSVSESPNTSVEMVGLLTRDDFSDMPPGFAGKDMIAVYIPFSYALGGYTMIVPRSRVRIVNMGIEDAMRFAITAGMTGRGEGLPGQPNARRLEPSNPLPPGMPSG
jgi:uncharacterized membrane protein